MELSLIFYGYFMERTNFDDIAFARLRETRAERSEIQSARKNAKIETHMNLYVFIYVRNKMLPSAYRCQNHSHRISVDMELIYERMPIRTTVVHFNGFK